MSPFPPFPSYLIFPGAPYSHSLLSAHVSPAGGRGGAVLAQPREHRSLRCGFICPTYAVCGYVGVCTRMYERVHLGCVIIAAGTFMCVHEHDCV